MSPTQVTVRLPVDGPRIWRLRPVGAVPRVGAIVPSAWTAQPDAEELAAGVMELALLATDEAGAGWAWEIRGPDNRRRTVAVPATAEVVAYADLVDVDPTDPSTALALAAPEQVATVAAEPEVTGSPAAADPFADAPAWMLDALRDITRRLALLEARDGAPPGETAIDPDAPDEYLAGFVGSHIGDYL